MDGSRFDALVRGIAGGGSRRGFVGGLFGLGVGLVGLRAAKAATCPPDQIYRQRVGCVCRSTGRIPVDGVCPCPSGQERCGEACVRPSSYQSDPANCGECGHACSPEESCRAGECIPVDQGTCQAGDDVCTGFASFCNNNVLCSCVQTINETPFCAFALEEDCHPCTTDENCFEHFGPGAACVARHGVCTGCDFEAFCVAPCPMTPF